MSGLATYTGLKKTQKQKTPGLSVPRFFNLNTNLKGSCFDGFESFKGTKMKTILKWWYATFPTYKETDVRFVTWKEADKLMKADSTWKLSKIEDKNRIIGMVWICKPERILIL